MIADVCKPALLLLWACAAVPRPHVIPSLAGPLLPPHTVDSVRGSWWYFPILDSLSSIADTAKIEHLRCLLGARNDSILVIVAAYEPEIGQADADSVRYGHCPALITVGTWHNHPPPYRGPKEGYCQLSKQDAEASELMQLISVDRHLSCLFLRGPLGYERAIHWPPPGYGPR